MIKSRYHGAGYMLVDNRASDWGNKIESDILCCCKCETTIHRHTYIDHLGLVHFGWTEKGGYCHRCDKPMCLSCASGPECPPGCGGFEKEFLRLVDESYHRQQNAKILGI